MASQIVVASTGSVQSELPQTTSSNATQWKNALNSANFTVGWSTWQYVLTFLLGVIVYDQGKSDDGLQQTLCFQTADEM